MPSQSFIVPAVLAELARLNADGRAFLAPHGPSDRCLYVVELALEEIFTNIVKYAHDASGVSAPGKHEVELALEVEGGLVRMVFMDQGQPFDPSQAPAPDPSIPAHERQPGGLGISITRNMARDMRYERQGDRNVLVVEVDLRGDA